MKMCKTDLFMGKNQNKKSMVSKYEIGNIKSMRYTNFSIKKYELPILIVKFNQFDIVRFKISTILNLICTNNNMKYCIHEKGLKIQEKNSFMVECIVKSLGLKKSKISYFKFDINNCSRTKLRKVRKNNSITFAIVNIHKSSMDFAKLPGITMTCKFSFGNIKRKVYRNFSNSDLINHLDHYTGWNSFIINFSNASFIENKYCIKVDLSNKFGLLNNNLVNSDKEVKKSNFKDFIGMINSINAILTRFFIFASNIYRCYVPPISDEIIPICNSMVEIICCFINKTKPGQWTYYVYICISCLLQIGDYFGTTEILGSILSYFNNMRSGFGEIEGISVSLWEEILELIQFLDEKTSLFFISHLSKIPINQSSFINKATYRYYKRMRLLLSYKLQKDIADKLNNVDKELIQRHVNNNFKDGARVLDCKYSMGICEIENINIEKYKRLKSSFDKKKNYYIQKHRERQFVSMKKKKNLYSINCFNFQTITNFENVELKMFKVIKYIYSKITLCSANKMTPFVNVNDVVVIQPFIKKKNQITLMSFRQLAKTEEINYSEVPAGSKTSRITLKLVIKYPGLDPSEYEYCLIFPILGLERYEKMIKILNTLCIVSHSNVPLFSELGCNVFNKSNYEMQINSRFKYWAQMTDSSTSILSNNCSLHEITCNSENSDNPIKITENGREDLLSFMLSNVSVSQDDLKILIHLSNSQRNAIFTSLRENITIIDGIEQSGKTLVTCILAYCRKKIDKSSRILIFTNNHKSIKCIKEVLEDTKISVLILEKKIEIEKRLKLVGLVMNQTISNSHSKYDTIILDSANKIDLVQNLQFDHIIVDDANMLCETDMLLLLTLSYHYITITYGISCDFGFNHYNSNAEYNCLKALLQKFEYKRCKLTKRYCHQYLSTQFNATLIEKPAFQIYSCNCNKVFKKLNYESMKICFIDVSFLNFDEHLHEQNFCFPEVVVTIKIIKSILKCHCKKQEANRKFCISAEKWHDLVEFPNIYLISHNRIHKKVLSKLLEIQIAKNSIPNWVNVSIDEITNFDYMDNQLIFVPLCYLGSGKSSKVMLDFTEEILKKKGNQKLVIIGDVSLIYYDNTNRGYLINCIINGHCIIEYSQLNKYLKYWCL
ncbi:hypothetical protein RS030_152338 [Cryptosporidium xiaoi]|uniref:Helicase ATP-binding domain-containing protein n=1 Tax=Cryptosporidium xiaoi TaxID=659607 RepID=A0AAV9Y242_9CRYT